MCRAVFLVFVVSALALSACGGAQTTGDSAAAASPASSEGDAKAASDSGIEWMHDDYASARAAAQAAGKPLVLDFWAPWCHTCLSMKHTVLKDPGLRAQADRFVWLALDTDRPENEAVVARFPIHFWPTFFVVDAADETVQSRLQGGAPLAIFRAFLEQGEAATLAKRSAAGRLADQSPLHHLTLGDQLATSGELAAADGEYAKAMSLAGPDWVRRPDVLVARIALLYKRGDYEQCVDFGGRHIEEAAAQLTASGADFAFFVAYCGTKGGLDAPRMNPLRERALASVRGLLGNAQAALSADDRADAMRIARTLMVELGREDEAREIALAHRDFLDRTAAAAETPQEVMTYNWPRAEVYAFLGEPEALIPALREQVAALPGQYDPPYRLAWILEQAGQHAEALEMAKLARAHVYGPRTARVDSLIETIEAKLAEAPDAP